MNYALITLLFKITIPSSGSYISYISTASTESSDPKELPRVEPVLLFPLSRKIYDFFIAYEEVQNI